MSESPTPTRNEISELVHGTRQRLELTARKVDRKVRPLLTRENVTALAITALAITGLVYKLKQNEPGIVQAADSLFHRPVPAETTFRSVGVRQEACPSPVPPDKAIFAPILLTSHGLALGSLPDDAFMGSGLYTTAASNLRPDCPQLVNWNKTDLSELPTDPATRLATIPNILAISENRGAIFVMYVAVTSLSYSSRLYPNPNLVTVAVSYDGTHFDPIATFEGQGPDGNAASFAGAVQRFQILRQEKP